MGLLRNLVTRVKERFFKPAQEKLSENSVPLFHFDRMTVDNELGNNPELAEMVKRGEQKQPGFGRLMEDIFGALYKENPSLLPEEAVEEEFRANRKHVADLMESEGYEKLREETKLNQARAIATARELAESILELAPQESQDRKEVERRKRELQELLNEAELANLEGLEEEEEQEIAREIEQAEQALERAQDKALRNAATAGRISGEIEHAAAETADRISRLMEMLRNFGYSKEQLERLSADTILEMLKEIVHHQDLRRMAEIIGRFRRIAKRLLRKSKEREQFTISGITLGDDIADMTPREAVSLLHPSLRPDFIQRWTDGELEVWEREDEIETGKGPIVICVDVSGSMEGEKDAFAKALLMAFLEIAKKEHRDLTVIFYDDYIREIYSIPRGRVRPEELIEILTFFTGLGTNFMDPLKRAKEIIRSHQSMQKADLLFITDGQARVDLDFIERFNQDRKKLGFKVLSAFVETEEGWNRESALELLRSFSDAVFDVRDLTDENAEAVISKMLED